MHGSTRKCRRIVGLKAIIIIYFNNYIYYYLNTSNIQKLIIIIHLPYDVRSGHGDIELSLHLGLVMEDARGESFDVLGENEASSNV